MARTHLRASAPKKHAVYHEVVLIEAQGKTLGLVMLSEHATGEKFSLLAAGLIQQHLPFTKLPKQRSTEAKTSSGLATKATIEDNRY